MSIFDNAVAGLKLAGVRNKENSTEVQKKVFGWLSSGMK